MDHNKGEEPGEMYSPDKKGEYGTATQASSFTIQGFSDALTTLDPQVTEVTEVTPTKVEHSLQLEVAMADWPGWLQPPPFLWGMVMVMHVLKGNPTLFCIESTFRWTDLALPTYSFMISKGRGDWCLRPPTL